jgi:hypothetical protein
MAELILKVVWIQKAMTFQVKSWPTWNYCSNWWHCLGGRSWFQPLFRWMWHIMLVWKKCLQVVLDFRFL